MAKPSFMYVAWLKARRSLIEGLYPYLPKAEWERVNEWFRRNIFEFGGEHTISLDMLMLQNAANKEEITEQCIRHCIHSIADKIYDKGMYQVETMDDPWLSNERKYVQTNYPMRRIRVRLLLCGSPDFIGPSEHKEFES